MISLAFNPLAFSRIIGTLSFDRTMGNTTLAGLDSAFRIQLFQFFNFTFIPICLVIGVLLCHIFTSKIEVKDNDDNVSNAITFLNSLSICALALTIIFIFNKYNIPFSIGVRNAVKNLFQQYSILALPFTIAVATLVYIKKPFIKFEVFRFSIYLSLGLTLFVNFTLQNNIGNSAISSFLRFYVIFAVVTSITLAFWYAVSIVYRFDVVYKQNRRMEDEKLNIERLKLSFVPLSFGMLFAGLSLEFFNILNQHGVYVVNRLAGAKLIFFAMFAFSVLLFVLANKKPLTRIRKLPYWETVSIIGLLVSLYYFTAIPPLQMSAGTELFEAANHGMLVNDFFAWGKFPMVNSFDAHTLSTSGPMLVYGALNGDVLGASYYFGYGFAWLLPAVVCMFLVYRNVFDKHFAFFFMTIAPRVSTLAVSMGIVSVIALLYAAKKQTFGAYLWLLVSVVIGLIYSIPTGFAYGGAAVIVAVISLIAGIIKERKFTDDSKAFLKALGMFVGVMIVLWTAICIQQHINPLKRILESLSITIASTNTVTYATLGDQTSINFGLLYSILPVLVVVCLIWLITHFRNNPIYLASGTFLLVYVLNVTRSLQRHSLAENSVGHIISASIFGIALLAAIIFPKYKRGVFIFVGIFIATAIFNMGVIPAAGSVASAAIATVNNSGIYYNGLTEKTTRVNLSAPLERHRNVIEMIKSIVPQGETYMDLSNQTMLYALTGKEKPVYVNQSQMELSGDYSQERFIEEIEDFKGICDFALLYNGSLGWGIGFDGLNHSYRYYKVYEYLYDNYRPLYKSTDDFALWVRKSRYEQFARNFNQEERNDKVADIPLDTTVGNSINDLNVVFPRPLVLVCGKRDPFISFPLTTPTSIAPAQDVHYELKVTYKSSISGSCRIFFNFAGFNETDSTRRNLSAMDEFTTAYFPIPIHPDSNVLYSIRLDPPGNSIFEVASISIVLKSAITPIDYDYLEHTHVTEIGKIPYVWGRYDKKKAWNNTLVAEFDDASGKVSDAIQQNAKYAMLTIDSPTNGNATLSFQNINNKTISVFNFSLLAGTNRYIIRVSTDWWWNNNTISSFTVSNDVNAMTKGVSFLVGD
jgi:hypothetical protein